MTTRSVDLRREALAEVERLTTARALLRDGDELARVRLESDAPWLAVATRTSLRRMLQGRACLVYRVGFEDACGRVTASRLIAILARVPRAATESRRAWLDRLVRDALAVVAVRVEAECETWRGEVVRTATTFASARLRLEGAINRRESRPHEDAYDAERQPGLFDRRSERSRETAAVADAESDQAASDRVRAINAAADIVPLTPRLLLVLAPRS
jgi:hypothetical protein